MLTAALASLSVTACAPGAAADLASPGGTEQNPDTVVDTNNSSTDAGAGFAKVPASTFDMGSTPGQPDYGYGVHSVTLTHDYYVGVTEVTQGEFQAVMGYNPSYFTDCAGFDPDNCPVESLNWHESAAYSNALSNAAGLQECYTCTGSGAIITCTVTSNPYDCTGYRLLTEAEWEGAARCGTDTEYAGSNTSADVAWTTENAYSGMHAGADLNPNTCGLYDMSGNVWEWTQDWFENYPTGGVTDPVGAENGCMPYRIYRGGGSNNNAYYATVSYRHSVAPLFRSGYNGFRVARSSPD